MSPDGITFRLYIPIPDNTSLITIGSTENSIGSWGYSVSLNGVEVTYVTVSNRNSASIDLASLGGGDTLEISYITEKLVEMLYERNNIDFKRGKSLTTMKKQYILDCAIKYIKVTRLKI